jgi:toxin ParE1/3/4
MARFRVAIPAQTDITNILATSAERWGVEGRRRYAVLLAAAMRMVAAQPDGPLTQARNELAPNLRSFHLRHARADAAKAKVKKPVHVLYYRPIQPGIVESYTNGWNPADTSAQPPRTRRELQATRSRSVPLDPSRNIGTKAR